MAIKELSILKVSPNDENDYKLIDEEARTIAESAQSTAQTAQSTAQTAQSTAQTAQTAQSTANSKLKTAVLSSSYAEDTKTLTLSISTTTN